jgi:hypothetical protein
VAPTAAAEFPAELLARLHGQRGFARAMLYSAKDGIGDLEVAVTLCPTDECLVEDLAHLRELADDAEMHDVNS